MKFLFAIVVIAIIALIGTRLTFLNRRLPIGFRNILLTGIEYIFIGAILGTKGLDLIDAESLDALKPFLLFGLAWIGFLFGLQFEFRLLRNLPRSYFAITAVEATTTFLIVATSTFFFLDFFLPLPLPLSILTSIVLGCVGSCSAQSAIAIVNRNYHFRNRGPIDLLRYISSVDGIFALLFFSIALCVLPSQSHAEPDILLSFRWLLATILMGAVPASILIVISNTKFTQAEFLLFVVGTVMFSGGLAFQIHHPPLISGLICGLITANFCRHRVRALTTAITAEKSIYIILLLLVGAGWNFAFDKSLLFASVYWIVRLTGKLAGTYWATRIYRPIYALPPSIGLGLLSEGGLGIAIIVSFRLLHSEIADFLITVVILSVVVKELIAPRLILAQFKDRRPKQLPKS